MNTFFKKSVELSMKIEKFINTISNSLILFEKEIAAYLEKDADTITETYKRICQLETEADLLSLAHLVLIH